MRLQMDQRNSGAQVGNPKSERASLAVTKIANWISPWITNYSIGSALVVHVVCLCPVPSTNCYHLVTSSSSSLSVSSLYWTQDSESSILGLSQFARLSDETHPNICCLSRHCSQRIMFIRSRQ